MAQKKGVNHGLGVNVNQGIGANLETNTRDITHSMASSPETGNEHLVLHPHPDPLHQGHLFALPSLHQKPEMRTLDLPVNE